MEKGLPIESTKKAKKPCSSHVPVNSEQCKQKIIEMINNAIKTMSDAKNLLTPSYIPSDPLPNISFWILKDEGKCGITITSKNAKYGWEFDFAKQNWAPCKYMDGMMCFNLQFEADENRFLTSLLKDCCYKYSLIRTIV